MKAYYLQNKRSIIMSRNRGFTMIELLTVISIIALLMAVLMPTLTEVKNQAKDAMCKQALHHWGIIFDMYSGDFNGKTVAEFFTARDASDYNYGEDENYRLAGFQAEIGRFYEHMWVVLLFPYYRTLDMCMCPATFRTWEDGIYTGSLTGWDFHWLVDEAAGEYFDYYGPPTLPDYAFGSYGKNAYCSSEVDPEMWCEVSEKAFPTVYVREAHRIPYFGDCMFLGSACISPTDTVPEYEDRWFMTFEGELERFVIARHGLSINMLFLDMAVRKVGLKQLWQLKWHAQWDQEAEENPPPDPYEREDWPDWLWRSKMYDL
jgi:prepilin-type N-terminal cleavage/methylation domain-containing protein